MVCLVIDRLIETLALLACELKHDREQRRTEHEWMKAHFGLATKNDLREMEQRLLDAIKGTDAGGKKLTELTAELKSSVEPLKAAIAEQAGEPKKA